MKTHNELMDYWRSPPDENTPNRYVDNSRNQKRSQFLYDVFQEIGVSPKHTILEMGCNMGRNLNVLWHEGYRKLYGIEINPDAYFLMKEKYPDMAAKIRIDSIESAIKTFRTVHVIFSMAVLMHLHPDSNWVFEEMVKRAKRWIITIEDENHQGHILTNRNYREIFTGLGMKCVMSYYAVPGANTSYICRVFEARKK